MFYPRTLISFSAVKEMPVPENSVLVLVTARLRSLDSTQEAPPEEERKWEEQGRGIGKG